MSVSADAVREAGLDGALLAWRAREGLSRLAAARRLGVAPTTLRSWEVGGVCPQPVHLPSLAAVLRRDVDEVRTLSGPDRVRTARTSGGVDASPLCRARLAAGLTMTQLARAAVGNFRKEVVNGAVGWDVAMQFERPAQMWSMRRSAR